MQTSVLVFYLLFASVEFKLITDEHNEHLYSPNQATRQTEYRLYTQKKEKNTQQNHINAY